MKRPTTPPPNLLGLTIEQAEAACKDTPYQVRLRAVNGQGLMGTADIRSDRINIEVENATETKDSEWTGVTGTKLWTVIYSNGKVVKQYIG